MASIVTARTDHGGETGSSTPVVRSLALGVLAENLNGVRKSHVLDLGPASGANVEFFGQAPCRLFIEDFYATLTTLASCEADRNATFDDILSSMSARWGEASFDVILCWDLLDYLSAAEIEKLSATIAESCNPGALLYALVSDVKQISDSPMQFRIVGPDRMSYGRDTPTTRMSPRYSPGYLMKLMPTFALHRSYMLSNGRQEHVFRYQ